MRLAELQYDLPPELIAQTPCRPRDAARLLVVDRASGAIEHRVFRDVGDYLDRGDCLVLNDTRVIPARFHCRRATGGKIEAFFLEAADDCWQVLLKPSARLREGEWLRCDAAEFELELIERGHRGAWAVRPRPAVDPLDLLARIGQTPLPPYIRRDDGPATADDEEYQTVYAEHAGAVAAPTAGLHFTPELLSTLVSRGVRRADLTLHVGPGTFTPIEVETLRDHRMHSERFSVDEAAAAVIARAHREGRRTVAVGTTAVRVLESFGSEPVAARRGTTDIFIYPPFEFQHTDRLITNFHLPGSTLLALVSAFCGVELARSAYQQAIAERYRFYSYGDAMLIL
ncbi:MAG: tRNA preQ1(34) S-adenosylmethionine ribosyltransferase-isomerase QueA [Planctomycetes bacterium]|nr:tRNA preQ1(34) S-adenosylmethionine ribosyltransferase-isomerase QueA [Planctomycetota bacterium]